ncbi:MAG: phenylalanine--tRNA ligase subunit beta [Candidatus Fervidibacter sp.]|uniref:phenylalanine--tRNA ligase subunit beta n=1 Tax=Candidatus Fervidibacter sp. TaxID=3100871 RepID=UPI0040496161
MKVPLSWIQEFVSVGNDIDKLAHTLEMAGLGVEGIEEFDGDVVFDLEITPNRGDWLSVYGVARELAAMLNLPLKPITVHVPETEKDINELAKVQIDAPDLCPRYSARLVLDVKVDESPDWLKRRLEACGIRPINNIVDITNYVLFELGHPLHAFDFDTLHGRQIIVRRAKDGESIYTLDEVRRELDSSMLVIADADRPVALAGIMGGLETAISPFTKNVLIESAHFSPSSIRRTSRKLGLRTESSYRFERWVNPNGTVLAADRAAQLMAELAGGKVCKGVIDVYPQHIAPSFVSVRVERVKSMLGIDISTEEVASLLRRLQFEVTPEGDTVHCLIPTFRNDIKREADLIEEIARLYGYDQIPVTLPEGVSPHAGESEKRELENSVRQFLTRLSLQEIVTLSLTNPEAEKAWGIDTEDNALKLRNPLTQDHTVARTSLIPSVLSVIAHNFRNGIRDIWMFELGKVYRYGEVGDAKSTEPRRLCIAITGNCYRVRWNLPAQTGQADFFAVKGIVERLLEWLGIDNASFEQGEHPSLHPYRTAIVRIGDKVIGFIGEVHPKWRRQNDLPQPVYIAELDFELLAERADLERKHRPLPQFPATQRDIAVVMPEDFDAVKVIESIKRVGGELVERVTVFDEYRGAPVPEGHRSVGFSITLRAKDRTLSSEEADEIVQQIKTALQEDLGLTTRG